MYCCVKCGFFALNLQFDCKRGRNYAVNFKIKLENVNVTIKIRLIAKFIDSSFAAMINLPLTSLP